MTTILNKIETKANHLHIQWFTAAEDTFVQIGF